MQKVHCNADQVLSPCLLLNNVGAIHQTADWRSNDKTHSFILLRPHTIYFCTFFLHSFYSHCLAFVLMQHLKTSVRKDPIASEAVKNNGLQSVLETSTASKVLDVFSLDFTVKSVLLPHALLFLLLWSCILVTHSFQLCLFLLSEMLPFCWQLISAKRCLFLGLFPMPTYQRR